MANSALIDDLRKQFAENPRRVFARLANEYRKRGELDSAIEICRSHVPLQPGYISGHIVLGQALFDCGSLDEARTTFETALALDPENLIALRHMGDIARASGDVAGARSWYRQLLEIDPQNEDVAGQLDSLSGNMGSPLEQGSAAENGSGGWGEVEPEPVELTAGGSSGTPDADEIEAEASAERDPLREDRAEALAAREAPEAADAAASSESAMIVEALEVSAQDDGAPANVDPAPLELVDLDTLAPEASESAFADAAEVEPASHATPPLYPPDPYGAAAHDGYDDEESGSAPGAFGTETMAELYLQQGFPDRALAIYRDLASRSPGDASLKERVAELEGASAATPSPVIEGERASRTAREFFGVLAYRRAPRETDPDESGSELFAADSAAVSKEDEGAAAALAEAFGDADAATDASFASNEQLDNVWVGGSPSNDRASSERAGDDSIDEVQPVQDVGALDDPADVEDADGARDGGVTASNAADGRGGKPGREASSALSLDDVFRDSPARAESRRESGVSFDEFFARRENGVVPESSNGSVAAEAEDADVSGGHRAEDAPQDLELFHAWLDGLKG